MGLGVRGFRVEAHAFERRACGFGRRVCDLILGVQRPGSNPEG